MFLWRMALPSRGCGEANSSKPGIINIYRVANDEAPGDRREIKAPHSWLGTGMYRVAAISRQLGEEGSTASPCR